MSEPLTKELDFIVDFGDTFTTIRACQVITTEVGDALFMDKDLVVVEMFAHGYWKRVKIKESY